MLISPIEHNIPTPASATGDANLRLALTKRASTGRLTWSGPLLLITGRSVLMIAAQAFVVCLSWVRFHVWSWNGAAKWWTVYGTLVDAGCLALMAAYTRKEGIRLRDLIGRVRLRWGRDFFVGVGCLLLVLPFFALGFPAARWLIYGSTHPPTFAGMLSARVLPLWGVAYSLSAWWLVWSPTEEMTYNGYALPRIEVLSGGRWKAVAIVGFWWALQHSFLPFILDWQYVAGRFFAFLPGVVAFLLIYLRLRRLPPLILAHWAMDISAVFFTLQF
ncbi:MAG: CPBP family glutamic-type intramembrane protease [Candidatus Sulfotelmatobacter sp.]